MFSEFYRVNDNMKTLQFLISFLLLITASTVSIQAQEKDPAVLQQMIDSMNFVFTARTVFPQIGSSRMLTTDEYDLRFSGDKVVSFLPYFGRVYSYSPGEDGGIKFTSTDFNYTVKKTKHGRRVTISPKDVRDISQMVLDISDNGYATLQVTSNYRQSISYYGIVEKAK
jgi:hypothetical protein